jgi:Zn-dependent protease
MFSVFDKIFGTRIRIHYTWLGVIVFMALSVTTQFATSLSLARRIVLGLVASLIFFVLVFLKELIIARVAISRGARIKSVRIFALGSVRDTELEKNSPVLETLLGVTGLLTNLVIAGILFVIFLFRGNSGSQVIQVLLQWTAFITFMVATINIIPVLPLDGGRVVGALVWKATGKYKLATVLLSWLGWVFGGVMVVLGVLLFYNTRQWFVPALMTLPGLVIQNSATHCRRLAQPKKPRRVSLHECS